MENPNGIAGGQYTVKVSPATGDAPAERSFEIRSYRPPRLRSQINFLSKGYGSGEQVTAFLKTERAEGGIPAGAQVTIVARVDNTEVHRSVSHVDDSGNCMARFDLPNAIERGEGTLAMIIEDGGVIETASKTIPLLLQHVDLKLYPEGGALVAGIENRIYLEAFTPAQKPADIAGIIVDQRGTRVGTFATEHEGRGRFRVTPESGRKYFLAIQQPVGIETQYPLPSVVDDGVAIRAIGNTFASDDQIAVSVTSSSTSDFVVALSHRGDEIESVDVRLTASVPSAISFDGGNHEGVFAVTVWKRDGKAIAERLVFRQPAGAFNVAIEPNLEQYVPGGRAIVTLTTTDQNGVPVEGVVGVTVTDDSVLEMLETRDHSPRLPAMVYLENDVLDLADAHVYLDSSNQDAPLAIDLLLGTQGWRRFITVDIKKAFKDYGDAAKRALAFRSPMATRSPTVRKLQERFMWIQRGAQLNDGILEGVEFQDEQLGRAEDDLFRVEDLALDKNGDSPLPLPPGDEPVPEPANAAQPEAPARPELPDDEKQLGDFDGIEDGAEVRLRELARQRRRNVRRGRFRKDDNRLRQSAERMDIASLSSKAQVQLREYAFKAKPDRQANQRSDFTETLFWSAATKTDQNGKATIEFDLNDSVTSFRVMADGFTTAGVIGAGTKTIESVEPFYVEPKLPLEVTSGDFLQIPLSLINATTSNMDDGLLSVQSDSWKSVQDSRAPFRLMANHRDRKLLGVHIGTFHGEANLTIDARSGAYSDHVTRQLVVQPQGFPTQQALGGIISPDANIRHPISIPADVVAGSVRSRIAVHPSPLARITESLKGLIREPHGCFEQTSSSNFPLVMAQQYFQSHVGVDPELVKRSAEMLDKGYQKLISFECNNKGFEWFGSDPGHDALTAYGLLQFTEMAKTQHVDSDLDPTDDRVVASTAQR